MNVLLEFLPFINIFFDELIICSNGFTASESLKSNACSIVADLIHNIRKQLNFEDLCKSINYFTKCLHDPMMYTNIQHMCCRVLLSLVDCIKAKEHENSNVIINYKYFKFFIYTY
jgi:transformation/transcription domain-associated protein